LGAVLQWNALPILCMVAATFIRTGSPAVKLVSPCLDSRREPKRVEQWTSVHSLTLAATYEPRALAFAAVCAPPVLSALISSQKPQILPVACCCVAATLVVSQWRSLNRPAIVFCVVAVAFA